MYHIDVFTKKTLLDQMGIDKVGVDEIGVDKMGSTRFIQKVPGLLPLLKCRMSDPNRNYMWRKMNTRPVI